MNNLNELPQQDATIGASSELIAIDSEYIPGLDRELGYFGLARFCLFYYVPRAESVVWDDGQSYGFGTGAWKPFIEHIEPLANKLKISLARTSNSHVLIIDRQKRRAYFAPRAAAEQFVDGQDPSEQVIPKVRRISIAESQN